MVRPVDNSLVYTPYMEQYVKEGQAEAFLWMLNLLEIR